MHIKHAAFAAVSALALVACGPTPSATLEGQGTAASIEVLPVPVIHPAFEAWGPAPAVDTNDDPDIVEVSLTAKVGTWELAPGQTVTGYTYNGQVPGPTIVARTGDRVIVHFKNELPEPTTVHWHGLRIPEEMDGSPRIQAPVPPGGEFTYDFVVPEAASFWYHPHVRANEQVEKGLYGAFQVREKDQQHEPWYPVERTLVLDDVLLQAGQFPPFLQSGMEGMHGRFGNTLLLNGRTTSTPAVVEVPRGRVERWRLVNTSNARTLELGLVGATWRVIGTDGGLLKAPYAATRLELPVGQRYDVEVTFATDGEATLQSYVLAQDAQGNVVERPLTQLRVLVQAAADTDTAVTTWVSREEPLRAVDAAATLEFDAVNDPVMGLMWRINGKAHATTPVFTFARGQTVLMRLTNRVGPEHPFHLHGQFFELLDAARPGLKDTVLVPGFESVEIVARFDNPGHWMAHCHVLEHAELGMMSEVVVTP